VLHTQSGTGPRVREMVEGGHAQVGWIADHHALLLVSHLFVAYTFAAQFFYVTSPNVDVLPIKRPGRAYLDSGRFLL
jgi:hypothetical protein